MDRWGALLYGDPCRRCGFAWSTGQVSSVSPLRDMPHTIDQLVLNASGKEHRSDLGWNVSGYIAHMTDNTIIWAERLVAAARGADPHIVPYDPDLLAEARHYNEVALLGAKWSLRTAVTNWLAAVEEAEPVGAVMLHSERGAMELSDVVASNAHDAFQHRWDVARILQPADQAPQSEEG